MTSATRTVCVVDRRRLVREGVALAASRLAPSVRWTSAASPAAVTGSPDVVLVGDHTDPDAPYPTGAAVVRLAVDDDLDAVVARLGTLASATTADMIATADMAGTAAAPGPSSSVGDRAPDPLTARERQVLAAVGRGGSAAEIGRELGVSPRTVEKHKQVVLAKLGARSQAEAVAIHAGARR